jgi:hypothetical protein
MRFLIKTVTPLKPKLTRNSDLIPQAEFTFKELNSNKEVRVIWPHDPKLTEGSMVPEHLEPGLLLMFREVFENRINQRFSVGKAIDMAQAEALDKVKDLNWPVPIYLVICTSGHPCSMPAETFDASTIGYQFRIDAQSVVNRLDKINLGADDYPMDHPKPAACGPHRVIPYCPIIEDKIHDEAERSGPGQAAPG